MDQFNVGEQIFHFVLSRRTSVGVFYTPHLYCYAKNKNEAKNKIYNRYGFGKSKYTGFSFISY